MILGLLWETPIGTALVYRVVGLSVLGGGIALWSFGFVGHIVSQNARLLDALLLSILLPWPFGWVSLRR